MIPTPLLALVLALSPAPPPAPAAAAAVRPAQDPVVDERPEVEALLEELKGHVDARGKQDKEAVAVIDKLVVEYPRSGPKDKAAIVKALDKVFTAKRQEDENGVRENQIFLAAGTALGEMAPESVPVLADWIGHKSHRRDVALQRLLILELGSTKHEDGLKTLTKQLDDPDQQIQGAAAQALGEFEGAELKQRKALFEELFKLMMTVKGQVDSDPNDIIARERWDVISAPIITSLQRLSKHQERDPQEWLHWWNKNKKADWDAEG